MTQAPPTMITFEQSRNLFRALGANGVFSLFSGLAMVLASGPIAGMLGVGNPAWIVWTGVALLGFAFSLLMHYRRKCVRRIEAVIISALDLAWVLGSLVLVLIVDVLSASGVMIVLIVAGVVLVLFEWQAWALWKHARGRPA